MSDTDYPVCYGVTRWRTPTPHRVGASASGGPSMALWLKLRYLLAYRHYFAADVDREIRRRLGHQ